MSIVTHNVCCRANIRKKMYIVKFINFRTPKNLLLIYPAKTSYHREICPKGVDGMASSVDPDQTAPLGAV